MTKREARDRAEKLRKEIDHHRYLYHVLDRAEISESALDSLKHELKVLEEKFPDLVTSDSPTQRVAGEALPFFKKVRHSRPMLSLEDVFDVKEFENWVARLQKLSGTHFRFFGELKIDGFAVSLTYAQGLFTTGATRGDGFIGEDVTQNLRTIESLPLSLRRPSENELRRAGVDSARFFDVLRTGMIEVRGEVFMTKEVFEKINREQIKQGLAPYANPRNTAAGSIRQLDPRIAASRALDFIAYDLVGDVGQDTHGEEHAVLRLLGFRVDPYARELSNSKEVESYWQEVEAQREKFRWEIDGIVVSVNENKVYEDLGVVGKAPRGAVAFKFPGRQSTTVVRDIRVQVGRTGVLTPIAELEPVNLSGVVVRRATLHNTDEIQRLGVKIGDTVVVERAGDVIPAVVEVLKNLRPKDAKAFHMPRVCPACGGTLRKEEVYTRCVNPDCPAKAGEYLSHFTSRKAFNIVGLSERILSRLRTEGIIGDAADLFDVKKEDIARLSRFGEKSAENLVRSIASARKVTLERLMYALGILHVGEETARDLAHHFRSIKRLRRATQEELEAVPNIGAVVARSIVQWFSARENAHFLDKLLAKVTVLRPLREKSQGVLAGRNVVFTGTLESFSREEAEELVRKEGGRAATSVSKSTDYVVSGANPGSKLQEAKNLGIKVLSEKDFKKLIL